MNDKKLCGSEKMSNSDESIPNANANLDRREFLRLTASAIGASLIAQAMPTLDVMAQGRDVKKKTPVFIQGQYRPQLKETTKSALKVRGAIPPALAGRYFRNGHNPPPDLVKGFWFGGQGMIHGVRLNKGKAEWYRNRFVQTPALKGAETFKKDGSVDLKASAAATSVYAHAGKIFALQEVNLPFLVSPELETLGAFDFDGALKTMMTAHPKVDPETGEMLFIANSPLPPHLTYHLADKTGKLVHSEVIEGPGASIIHDFAITKNYVVYFDPSVTFDPKSKLPFAYSWKNDYQAKIGIMPRDRTKGATKWVSVPSYYYFHLANAYEDSQGRVVIEGTSYDKAGWDHSSKWINSLADHDQWVVGGSRYTRWTVDAGKGTCDIKYIDDLSLEFSRYQLRFARSAEPLHIHAGLPVRRAETSRDCQIRRSNRRAPVARIQADADAGRSLFRRRPERQSGRRRLDFRLRQRLSDAAFGTVDFGCNEHQSDSDRRRRTRRVGAAGRSRLVDFRRGTRRKKSETSLNKYVVE